MPPPMVELDALHEPERLAALQRLALENLEPEDAFDRLTRLATAVCSAPTALITFVGDDYEHLKSARGLPEHLASLRRIPISHSIGQYVVASRQPLVVSDARQDPVLCTSWAVTELGVGAYAGVPLVSSHGHCVGTISAIDRKPREWTDAQLGMLQDLAAVAITELDLRRELAERRSMGSELQESERKRADVALGDVQAELRGREELFRSLIEHTSDVIAIVDTSGVILYASPSVERVLGYAPEDLAGRVAVELVHPDDWQPALDAHVAAIRSGWQAQPGVEFRFRHRNGTWRILEARGSAVQSGSSGTRAVLTLRDVTNRRRAEAALRESEERLRLSLEAGKCGIWDWDIASGRVTWSDRVYELYGLVPGQFGGSPEDFLALVHPEDVDRVRQAGRQSLQEQADYEIEFRVVQPSGEARWLWTNGQVLFAPDGTPIRMLGATLDTTDRRRAEEALRASHEQLRQLAHRLDEVREEELTRISREIHDELGYALTALRLDLAWLVLKLRRNREPVREKAGAMLALVDDTIDSVRRIAAQLRAPVLEDLGLGPALESLVDRFAAHTGVAVQLQSRADEVPSFARRPLYRIAQEALTNVARYARAKRVTVVLESAPDAIVLEISDDGVGIPPGTLDNYGSLGLVGMRERAAALGADFQLRSGAEGGTTIRVTLPRRTDGGPA